MYLDAWKYSTPEGSDIRYFQSRDNNRRIVGPAWVPDLKVDNVFHTREPELKFVIELDTNNYSGLLGVTDEQKSALLTAKDTIKTKLL